MSTKVEKLIIKVGVENGEKPLYALVPIADLHEDPLSVLSQQAVFLSQKGHVPLEEIAWKDYSVTYMYTDADGDDMYLDSKNGLATAMKDAVENGGKLKLLANVKKRVLGIKALRPLKLVAGLALASAALAAGHGIAQEIFGDRDPSLFLNVDPTISEEEKCKRFQQYTRYADQSTTMVDCNWFLINALNGGVANPEHGENDRLNIAYRAAIQEIDFKERQRLLREVLGADAPLIDDMTTEGTSGKTKQIRQLSQFVSRAIQSNNVEEKKQLLVKALEGLDSDNKRAELKALRRAKNAAAKLETKDGAESAAFKSKRPMPIIKELARSALQSRTVGECRKFLSQALGDDTADVATEFTDSLEELWRLKQIATAVLGFAGGPGPAKKLIRDALTSGIKDRSFEMQSLSLDGDQETDIVVDPIQRDDTK